MSERNPNKEQTFLQPLLHMYLPLPPIPPTFAESICAVKLSQSCSLKISGYQNPASKCVHAVTPSAALCFHLYTFVRFAMPLVLIIILSFQCHKMIVLYTDWFKKPQPELKGLNVTLEMQCLGVYSVYVKWCAAVGAPCLQKTCGVCYLGYE